MAGVRVRIACQGGVSPTRFYVHEKAYVQYLEVFVNTLKTVKVGDGLDPDTQMGPLAHARRVPTMTKFVENALELGGKFVLGGDRLARTGHFFAPTVVKIGGAHV